MNIYQNYWKMEKTYDRQIWRLNMFVHCISKSSSCCRETNDNSIAPTPLTCCKLIHTYRLYYVVNKDIFTLCISRMLSRIRVNIDQWSCCAYICQRGLVLVSRFQGMPPDFSKGAKINFHIHISTRFLIICVTFLQQEAV